MKKPTLAQCRSLGKIVTEKLRSHADVDREKIQRALKDRRHEFWAHLEDGLLTLRTPTEDGTAQLRTNVFDTTRLKMFVSGGRVKRVGPMHASKCFTDRSVFAYRDPDFDNDEHYLTADIPPVSAGPLIGFELLQNGMKFQTMAQAVLGTKTDDLSVLAQDLIKQGKSFALKQVEDIIARYEGGEKTLGLLDNGWANFFFVHDKKGGVCIVNAYRFSAGWYVRVYRLDRGDEWHAEARLFVRN